MLSLRIESATILTLDSILSFNIPLESNEQSYLCFAARMGPCLPVEHLYFISMHSSGPTHIKTISFHSKYASVGLSLL